MLFFECSAASRADWQPDDEIAEVAFLAVDALPKEVSPRTYARIAEAFEGVRGAVRIFKDESDSLPISLIREGFTAERGRPEHSLGS